MAVVAVEVVEDEAGHPAGKKRAVIPAPVEAVSGRRVAVLAQQAKAVIHDRTHEPVCEFGMGLGGHDVIADGEGSGRTEVPAPGQPRLRGQDADVILVEDVEAKVALRVRHEGCVFEKVRGFDTDIPARSGALDLAAQRNRNRLMTETGADQWLARGIAGADKIIERGQETVFIEHGQRRAGDQKRVLLVEALGHFIADGHVNAVGKPLFERIEKVTEAMGVVGKVIADAFALVVIDLQYAEADPVHGCRLWLSQKALLFSPALPGDAGGQAWRALPPCGGIGGKPAPRNPEARITSTCAGQISCR